MNKIRVLIADDHVIVREGLRQLLNGQTDMEVAGEAEDGRQALEEVKSLHPDVILLDIAMPHLSGLEVISLIREAAPETQVASVRRKKRIVVKARHIRAQHDQHRKIRQHFGAVIVCKADHCLDSERPWRKHAYDG